MKSPTAVAAIALSFTTCVTGGCGGSSGPSDSARSAAWADLKVVALAQEAHFAKTGQYADSIDQLVTDAYLTRPGPVEVARGKATSFCLSTQVSGTTYYLSSDTPAGKPTTVSCV